MIDVLSSGRLISGFILGTPMDTAFVNGLIVATLAGALCGLVGVYVVLKGMSYIGHGLSHAPVRGIRVWRRAPLRRFR